MKPSTDADVRQLYDDSAEWYAELMDAEIHLPVYADTLSRLAARITSVAGAVIDTSCGPGHMLRQYRDRFDRERALIGVDLSVRMVALASAKLASDAKIQLGDMRRLADTDSNSAAAILSFFAVHHLDLAGVSVALIEWCRVLKPNGQLVLTAWEGTGAIDYGDQSDVVALRYTRSELSERAESAGFVVDRCEVQPVDGMPMDAVYLEATKA